MVMRWVGLLVFMTVMAIIFVNLGEWQLRRLDQRRERNQVVITNNAAPVRDFSQVFGGPIRDEDQWQRVRVHGTFDATHQLQVRYRANNSQPGFEVVTPLRTDNGIVVLVDRGFIGVPRGEQIPETLPAPPTGPVDIVGHVRRSENGKDTAIVPVNNQVRLINAPAIGRSLPYPVVDGYLSALEVTPAQSGDLQPIALPEINEGPHLSYAIQWFLFTAIGVGGVVILIRGDLKQRRKDRERAARQARDAPVHAEESGTETSSTATAADEVTAASARGE